MTLDLCARLSIGQLFPDGRLGPGPSNSIVLDGEDNDTIRPRLQALGADLEGVFVLDPGRSQEKWFVSVYTAAKQGKLRG